jgi:quercetin dioxygenase-like cupin family protein
MSNKNRIREYKELKMAQFIELNNLDYFIPLKGLKAKLVHTNNQTYAFWKIEKNTILPEHQHPNEQVSIVTKGELELTIGNVTQIMKQGMVAVIPSNTDHSAKAITDVEITDIFYPVREDFK